MQKELYHQVQRQNLILNAACYAGSEKRAPVAKDKYLSLPRSYYLVNLTLIFNSKLQAIMPIPGK